jgi:LacI family transcriptional regulator
MSLQRPILGVITNFQHGVFQRAVIHGIRQVADLHSFDVQVDSLADDPSDPRPVSLNIAALAGLVVISDAIPDEQILRYHAQGLPLSLVSHQVRGAAIPAVVTDNRQGVTRLMQHLVEERGRRRVVYIGGIATQSDAREREHAFRDEVMRYTLDFPPSFHLKGEFDPDIAAQALRDLLRHRQDFDAIFAADYRMAIATLGVLADAGLRVPADVCVVGYGDDQEAEAHQLTVVAADIVEQGRRGARQLMGQMRGLTMRGVTVLNTVLIQRHTT